MVARERLWTIGAVTAAVRIVGGPHDGKTVNVRRPLPAAVAVGAVFHVLTWHGWTPIYRPERTRP